MGRAHLTRSARLLLAELIDYAGLFPPASLSMADAVSRYARYRRGPHAWMLGRFIVPRPRLEEFDTHARPLIPDGDGAGAGVPWRLSVLATDDVATDARAIERFNAVGCASIDTVEAKVTSAADVTRIADELRREPPLTLWFEVSPGAALASILDAIARAGAGAKLRAGGVTPDAIPAAADIARFLIACARTGIACKMTAGLHHPVHAPHRLTYADDSPTALMHGFVNVFLAAAFAREWVRRHPADAEANASADADMQAQLVSLLDERDAHRIVWHDDHVAWRGHRLDIEAIAAARAEFARSFGSCSFDDPVEDLEQLGWL